MSSPREILAAQDYVEGVLSGDRSLLGRAITLIESNAEQHQERAQEVLAALLPAAGKSVRMGISGLPGSGKSTLVETLGHKLTSEGHRLAVLAVDPSSSLSKGSILGDKTRMENLARDPSAFIRPSPSGGTLGGVARKTRETMVLFEAAGYDVLIVETVGVGQSEISVRGMVDFFLLVLIAGAGDELQGIKRGIIEIADGILINKADGENREAAEEARASYERALQFLSPATAGWTTPVRSCSALHGEGIVETWQMVEEFTARARQNGVFDQRRKRQSLDWLHKMVEERLHNAFYHDEAVRSMLDEVEQEVLGDRMPVTQAAWKLLEAWDMNSKEPG